MHFASIPEAIEDFRRGKILVVVDDEDRENEGDLTIAAEKITPEAINFMATHGRGGLLHLFLGSVAESVLRAAPCPVLTLRPQ